MTRLNRNHRNPEDNPAYLHDHYQNTEPEQGSVNAITGTMPQPPGMNHEVEMIYAERAEVLAAVRQVERLLTSSGKSAIRTTEAGGEINLKTVSLPPTPQAGTAVKIAAYNYNRSRIHLYAYSETVAIGTDPNIQVTGITCSANAVILPAGAPLVLTTVRDIWAVIDPTEASAIPVLVIEEFMVPSDR